MIIMNYKEILFLVLLLINSIMYFIVIFATNDFKEKFYKMGIMIFKNKIIIKNKYYINDIEKIIKRENVIINIKNENKILFSSNLNSILINRIFLIWPIFGECYINNNIVKIIYKIPIFFILIVLLISLYLIEFILFLAFIFCLIIISHFFRIKITKFELEYYLNNRI